MEGSFIIQLAAQLFSLLVGIISYKRKSVSTSGLAALIIISSLFIWLNQIPLLFVLFLMFATSSLLTHYKKTQKKEFDSIIEKHGPRDYIQALSNLGVATFLVILISFTHEEIFIASLVASVCTANADSWASEIGGLSKRTPILITTLKPCPKGVSGGITLLGSIGGIIGSLFISISAIVLIYNFSNLEIDIVKLFICSSIAGIIGFIVDSIIGALFQATYINPQDNAIKESKAETYQLIKGYSWMNNDMVNFITTFLGGILGGVLYYLFD